MKYLILTLALTFSLNAHAQNMTKQEHENLCSEILTKINGHLKQVTDKDRIKDNKHLNLANLMALSYAHMRCDAKALYELLK